MALAAAITQIEAGGFATLTNYGAFLADYRPALEVEILEQTSWSCAHGVERWRRDCGCKTRGEWHQRWRDPMRRALDQLKGRLDALFATHGRQCFADPWAARDAYIDVVHDRGDEAARAFSRNAAR